MGDRVAVMSQGELQQVAGPQELYDRPANLFVAAFIGTPPMNLIEGQVITENGSTTVVLGPERLPLVPETLAAYPGVRAYEGRTVVVGIRPTTLHPASERPDLPTFTAKVELIEALGSESMAYFRVEAKAVVSEGVMPEDEVIGTEGVSEVTGRPNLVASFPPHIHLRVDQDVPIAVDVAGLHFFDPETGAPLR
jgi:multiple sugar transport system ATP-binding protein